MDVKMNDATKDSMVRRNAFLETDNETLIARRKELEFDCAELQRENEHMREKIKTLSARTPEWPKGYKSPRKNFKKSAR